VIVTSQVFPLILRVNLREEADKLWQAMGGHGLDESARPAVPELVGRVYTVTGAAGLPLRNVSAALQSGGSVQGLMRHGHQVAFAPDTSLEADDQVLVVGHRRAVVRMADTYADLGHETPDAGAFDVVMDSADVILGRAATRGLTLRGLHVPKTLGDEVGAMTFGGPPEQRRDFAPRKGGATLNALMNRLHDIQPGATH
jgi:uncharacterized transporter YbjL